jgi:uncharacterized protein Yka (UPF0111/DUF47 family)
MPFNLFPKPPKFFELFEEQNRHLIEAAALLSAVFQDFTDAATKCRRIAEIESEGDRLSITISRQLALTFITPIDREDIYGINMAQEAVLNAIRAISTRVGLYGFTSLPAAARDLAANLKGLVGESRTMLERLRRRQEVDESTTRVGVLKTESDLLLLVALGELYESKAPKPEELLNVVKLSQIYDRLEAALSSAAFLANVIEGVVLKNA